MATMVMFLSVGIHISKMKCAEDGQLYFGTEVPSCSMEKEVSLLCKRTESNFMLYDRGGKTMLSGNQR